MALILVLVLSLVSLFSFFIFPAENWKYYIRLPDVPKRKSGEMRLHFLDVGQGDCTLIELPDGKKMLVDGGNGTGKTAKTVLRYLNALDVEKLDYLVCTHTDSDHCGSLDTVVEQKKIGKAFLPAVDDYTISDEYAELYAALKKRKIAVQENESLLALSTAQYRLVFLSPYGKDTKGEAYDKVNQGDYNSDDLNDTSAVIWLEYNGVRALLAGDATERVEENIMRDYLVGAYDDLGVNLDKTEILKVAHHGGEGSTGNSLLAMLGVKMAVISVAKANTYGHPSATTLDRLTAFGANVYRTDERGTVRITVSKQGEYTVKTKR